MVKFVVIKARVPVFPKSPQNVRIHVMFRTDHWSSQEPRLPQTRNSASATRVFVG